MSIKHIVFLLSLVFYLSTTLNAQPANRGDELMKQAQAHLEQKEYVKARYQFLQAYNSFERETDYQKSVACGIKAAFLYSREGYYKEAFDLCRGMEQLVSGGERKEQKTYPELRYLINKERLQMYISLRRTPQAKEMLGRLEESVRAAKSDSLSADLLYTQANYYYTFGMMQEGDDCLHKLVEQYMQQKEYDKVDECYRNFIEMGRKANNAGVVAYAYGKYMVWADSVKAITAQEELDALQTEYKESLQIIEGKEKALSVKQYIIIALCVLAVALAVALVFGCIVLLRFVILTRKQKKAIQIANEHNELKTTFIRNISAQMEPTLNTLDNSQPGVQALRSFSEHIQTLSDLENSLSVPYEMQMIQVNPFCESVMERITVNLKPDVTTVVNAPKLSLKTNPEQLERVLLHLLNNAAEYTPEGGKITLEFKKRGANTHQFIISDTGDGIPAETQDNLFKPFAEVKDLTQGDGLGLPICSLIAAKLNGTLTLDTAYTRGCRFILELHT